MKILISNPGSTSYKCKFYESSDMSVLFQSSIERIGQKDAIFTYSYPDKDSYTDILEIDDYFAAIEVVREALKKI